MIYDEKWAEDMAAKRAYLAENGLYSEAEEHSSCGVGLVVNIDGSKSRAVVENGIKALKAIWHRGAVDADGMTGDGAGIHLQIPVPFFYDQVQRTGHTPRENELIAVGQVFLPRTNFSAQETCRTIVEPKCCAWAITSTAGAMCRWIFRCWVKRPTRHAPRSSRS